MRIEKMHHRAASRLRIDYPYSNLAGLPPTDEKKRCGKPLVSAALCTLVIATVVCGLTCISEAQSYSILYSFVGPPQDGSDPLGSLLLSGSNLYGLTSTGGDVGQSGNPSGYGTIFDYNLVTSKESILHSFGLPGDGIGPAQNSLILSGSVLYGMTPGGGPYESFSDPGGTLFKYNLNIQSEGVAYSFMGGTADGADPQGSLLQSGSALYGVTFQGGPTNAGAIFEYNLNTNTEDPLYLFGGIPGTRSYVPGDAENPYGSLIQSGSTLYGLSFGGGTTGLGTIFRYNIATNQESVLHSFVGGTSDGGSPLGSLVQSGSILYGMTDDGGVDGKGTIFEYNLNTNSETLIYSFLAGNDGEFPEGSLTVSGSKLYGMTSSGGKYGLGTVFAFDLATNTETVVHSFGDVPNDGASPDGSLVLSGSTLYGVAQGSASNEGIIFSLTVPEPTCVFIIGLSSIGLLTRRCRN